MPDSDPLPQHAVRWVASCGSGRHHYLAVPIGDSAQDVRLLGRATEYRDARGTVRISAYYYRDGDSDRAIALGDGYRSVEHAHTALTAADTRPPLCQGLEELRRWLIHIHPDYHPAHCDPADADAVISRILDVLSDMESTARAHQRLAESPRSQAAITDTPDGDATP